METKKFDFEIKIFKPEYKLTFDIENIYEDQKKLEELMKTNPFTEGEIIHNSEIIGSKNRFTEKGRCYPSMMIEGKKYEGHCSPAQGLQGKIKATNVLDAIRKIMNETNDKKIDYFKISYQNNSSDLCELTYNAGLIEWRNYEKQKFLFMKPNSDSYKTLDRIINN